ncbi:hypothetical protein MBLNU459_g2760t1 [Dothideomycetes sp. NU459]
MQDIPSGARIIEEEPLMKIRIGQDMDESILDCFGCLSEAGKAAYLKLCTYDIDPGETGTVMSATTESIDEANIVLDTPKLHVNNTETHSPQPGLTRAETKDTDSSRVIRVFRTNAFGLETAPSTSTTGGICLIGARLNHSCLPNVFCTFNSSRNLHTVHAVRDIAAGEELSTSYIAGSFMLRAERLDKLAQWGFRCACPACGHNEDEERRLKIKELEAQASEARASFAELSLEQIGQVASTLEELARLMVEEGLLNPELANIYQGAAVCNAIAGNMIKALEWRCKFMETMLRCYGSDNPATMGSAAPSGVAAKL